MPAATISVLAVVLPHQRRGPSALFVARRFPTGLASGAVDGGDVRLFLIVVDHDHLIALHDRRRGRSVAEHRLLGLNRMGPQLLSVEVVAIQSDVAKQHVKPFAVGGGRLGRVGALGMARYLRLACVSLVLPEHLAGLQGSGSKPSNGVRCLAARRGRRPDTGRPSVFRSRRRPVTAETNTRSPQTIGLPQPQPGIVAFHFTFVV